jgi:hypothetical protein
MKGVHHLRDTFCSHLAMAGTPASFRKSLGIKTSARHSGICI